MRIKKNDNVIMLSGKDRGKSGKVLKLFPREAKVIVEGLNVLTRHQRPRRQGEKGQKVQVPRRVALAKVMLLCPKCSKRTRVEYRIEGAKKERICKKCERTI